ncbi:hypothetical protein SBA7_320057 [Candidatus Sulfotelmatobacter sp. SbA7]|nr:hypothetical protein SBA7_320057 [Candidatus Sulfotelmatobacter sp. SbA7]
MKCGKPRMRRCVSASPGPAQKRAGGALSVSAFKRLAVRVWDSGLRTKPVTTSELS